MGSVFGDSKPSTPPPAPPSSYKDELAGVEQVPVKNPDGSITYVTRKLPLTEEQKQKQAEYDKIMSDSLAEIKKLSSSDYEFDEQTKAKLDAYEQEQLATLASLQSSRTKSEEEALAARGLQNSSVADSLRRQRSLDAANVKRSIERERAVVADDIRTNQLNYQQNLYNIAAQKQDMDAVRAQQSIASSSGATSALNKYQKSSIADAYAKNNSSGNFIDESFDNLEDNPILEVFGGMF